MQDSFDKKLAERIVQVFDKYEDGSADQGWEQLRLKYQAPQRRSSVVYWLGSAAAILLLIAGVWLFYPNNEKIQLASKEQPKETVLPQENDPSEPGEEDLNKADEPAAVSKKREENALYVARSVEKNNELNLPAEEQPVSVSLTMSSAKDTLTAIASEQVPVIASADIPEQIREQAPAVSGEVRRPQVNVVAESYDELQQAKRELLAKEGSNNKEKSKDSKLSFSLYAGSYVSYAEGSKSRVNTGVGISSELGLTSKLKLTTGISIAQNSLRYDSRIPEQAAASFLSSTMSTSQNLMVAGPDAKVSAINYSIHGYDASLMGLDVPVNLKYTFFEKKDQLYVVAGLSSNFFFDETYTYDYGYNSIHGSSVESFPNEKTTTNTSSFDFARMLNLSVGYGYPVGKQSKLSLEPFLKYPLGGLGSQDIRFSSAGLNLKWNFNKR